MLVGETAHSFGVDPKTVWNAHVEDRKRAPHEFVDLGPIGPMITLSTSTE